MFIYYIYFIIIIMRRRHLYHIVRPNPWPILLAAFSFFFVSGFTFSMYRLPWSGTYCLVALAGVAAALIYWLLEGMDESVNGGSQTKIVSVTVEQAICLFFASEVMIFFALFWAYAHMQ